MFVLSPLCTDVLLQCLFSTGYPGGLYLLLSTGAVWEFPGNDEYGITHGGLLSVGL